MFPSCHTLRYFHGLRNQSLPVFPGCQVCAHLVLVAMVSSSLVFKAPDCPPSLPGFASDAINGRTAKIKLREVHASNPLPVHQSCGAVETVFIALLPNRYRQTFGTLSEFTSTFMAHQCVIFRMNTAPLRNDSKLS